MSWKIKPPQHTIRVFLYYRDFRRIDLPAENPPLVWLDLASSGPQLRSAERVPFDLSNLHINDMYSLDLRCLSSKQIVGRFNSIYGLAIRSKENGVTRISVTE